LEGIDGSLAKLSAPVDIQDSYAAEL